MYTLYEISLVIIAFVVLFFYVKTTSKLNECEAEEDFGNFTNSSSSSPVIAFINSKSSTTNDINIKKILFIPKIFSNNVYYKDSDYNKISKLSLIELGAYVKNNNILLFVDLLNQFTQDLCSPSELKFVLNLFANKYITFNNIPGVSQETVNTILSTHLTLYLQVKNIQKLYIDLLSINKIDQTTFNKLSSEIDSQLNNVIQKIPQITNILEKIKTSTNNLYVSNNDMIDRNLICVTTSIDSITSNKSKSLNQIKSFNISKKFTLTNIEYWIPFYVKLNLTDVDISQSNDYGEINEVFLKIIFPKIFNYSLTLIELMNELSLNQKNRTMINAIDFFNKYVSTYLILYISVITEQSESEDLLELQKMESKVSDLYNLLVK